MYLNFNLTVMIELIISPSIYLNLFKYLQLTVTISTCSLITRKRFFGALIRVKTWLGSTIEQIRF